MPLLQSNFNDQNERFQEVQLLPGMLQVVYTRDVQEKGLLRKIVLCVVCCEVNDEWHWMQCVKFPVYNTTCMHVL